MNYDITKILNLLMRRLWIVAITVVITGTSAYIAAAYLINPIYVAKAQMLVTTTSDQLPGQEKNSLTASDYELSKKLVNTYIVILRSDPVLEKVAKESGLNYSVDQIRDMLSATDVNNTEVLQVTVKDENPQNAEKIANTVATVAPAEIIRVVKAGAVEVINFAKVPTQPSSPSKTIYTLAGILFGLIISFGLIFVFDLFDNTIKSEDGLTETYKAPVLGIIPSHDMKSTK